MAFKDPTQRTFSPSSPNLVGEIIDVNVNSQNPMLSTITVRANPADNLNIYSGDYTLKMDSSKTLSSRLQVWQKARVEGTGFCGALITEDSKRRKGDKILFEGVRFTDDRNATTSWLRSYSNERRRSPGLLKTIETTATDPYSNEAYKAVKLISVACQEGDAFNLHDENRWSNMLKRADHFFKLGTAPSDHRNEKGQLFLRASMPATSATFALLDNESNEIVEYSTLQSKIIPNPADYPEHFTDRDKFFGNGKRAYIPRNGENLEIMRKRYMEYISEQYPGRNLTPLCVELTEYRVTTKTMKHRDLQSPLILSEGANPNPLQDFHQVNAVKFRDDSSSPQSFSRGAYHPDICLQKSPNAGQTFSQYVRPEYDFLPEEFRNKPWLSFVKYNGQPLQLNAQLMIPHDMQQNPLTQNTTSSRAAQSSHQATPHNSAVQHSPTEHQSFEPATPSAVQHSSTEHQPEAAIPSAPVPNDPAFSEEDGLMPEEVETQELNRRMAQHEQEAAGIDTANPSVPVPRSPQAPSDATSTLGSPVRSSSNAPMPDTNDFSELAQAHSFTDDDCPFNI